jgi:hypothetical protein
MNLRADVSIYLGKFLISELPVRNFLNFEPQHLILHLKKKAVWFELAGVAKVSSSKKEQPREIMQLSLDLFDNFSLSKSDLVELIDQNAAQGYYWNDKQASDYWNQSQRAEVISRFPNFRRWDFFDLSFEIEDGTDAIYQDVWFKQTAQGHDETDRSLRPSTYLRYLTANAEALHDIAFE